MLWIRLAGEEPHPSQMELYAGDVAASRVSGSECAAHAPLSAHCPLTADEGASPSCERYEARAREAIARGPSPAAFEALASALAARGAPRESIADAVAKAIARTDDATGRRNFELRTSAEVAAYMGDFNAAIAAATEMGQLAEASDDIGDHTTAARLLARSLTETGDPKAGDVARDFLARRDAWQSPPWPDDGSLAHDATGELLGVAHDLGKISDAEYDRQLERWRSGWATRLRGEYRSYLWFSGYAAEASTPEGAKRALDAEAAFGAPPIYFPNPGVDGDFLLGRTLVLAGRPREALSRLETAAATCWALGRPFEQTWARLYLGKAKEALGDVSGACASYAAVVDRWGDAKPRSVSAEDARARIAALGCGNGGAHR